MDKGGFAEKISMKEVLDGFISSYVERDRSLGFDRWLEDKLQQEIPGMPEGAGGKMADEIIRAVENYDKTLDGLNKAIGDGQSKEEWLTGYMGDIYAGIPIDTVGQRLRQIENGLTVSNMKLLQGIAGSGRSAAAIDDADPIEWNEYNVKNTVYRIEDQMILTGTAVAANILKEKMQDDSADMMDAVKQTLQSGLKKDSGEVKAIVAGAIKVAAEKELGDLLPEDTPVELIGDMAGAAVEAAEALYDVMNGESPLVDAIDKIGRANVAAGCRYMSWVLEKYLQDVPVLGPVLVDLAGGLLEHMEGPKFTEDVYNTVRNMVIAAWEGVKKSRTVEILGEMKNVVFG